MEQNPNTSASKFSFIILLAALGMMVAVTFMPKKQPPEEKKSAAAAEQQKTPAAEPAVREPEVKTTKGGKLTPAGVLVKTAKKYDAIAAYTVDFTLQQPRTPKESRDIETMEKLHESLRLHYKKRAKNDPLRDAIRLEAIDGFNKCTDLGYAPGTGKVTVYRPGTAPLKLAPGDKRLGDFFKLGLHTTAADVESRARSGKYAVTMIEESHSFMPGERALPMYVIEMKRTQTDRIMVFVDKKSFALRAVDLYLYNKKGGKTETERFVLNRRMEWAPAAPMPPASYDDSWYTRASNYKNRNCMR